MKRSALLPLAPLLLISTLSGCQGFEELLDESPVAEKAFYAGAVVGGAPAVVAFAPVTIPLAAASDSCHGGAAVLLPGIPTGLIGGVTLGLPVLLLETIVRLPGRLWDRATGRGLERGCQPAPEPESESKPVPVPRPEPVTAPEPAPPTAGDDSPYRNWPKLGREPRHVAWPRDVPR